MAKNDDFARRRMAAWKALPEPRISWEAFKRVWKDPQTRGTEPTDRKVKR